MVRSTYTFTFWQYIVYGIAFGFAYTMSLLPFWLLYLLSDGLFFLTYRVIRYRRTIVRKNLKDSFPEKSPQDLIDLERDFYHWFCDYIVETLKLFSISASALQKRMRFRHCELVEDIVANGQGVALYLGHYCNWEWISSIPLSVKGNYVGSQVYHVLESPVMDKLLLYPRHRMGAENVAIMDVLRFLVTNKQEGKPVVMGFIADQTPYWNNIGHWVTFLNHPQTPVLGGTEKIARRFNMACVFIEVKRIKRGYYEADFQLMSRVPDSEKEHAITEEYFRRLEDNIRRQPALWLWTHNRWKRTREEYDTMIDPETGKFKM